MIARWQLVSLSCFILCSSCGDLSTSHRSNDAQEENLSIADKIERYKKQSQEALSEHDIAKFGSTSLEVNYLTELQSLPADADPETKNMLDSKYELLKRIFEDQVAEHPEYQQRGKPSAQGAALMGGGMKIEVKDQVYTGPDFTSVYHPRVLEEVNRVFEDLGDLYVNEIVDHKREPVPQEIRVRKPWSGYWYPFNDDVLYNSSNSPLAKFDRVLNRLGFNSQIMEAERQRYLGFKPDSWEGLCDAWSLAAIMMPEPTVGREIEGEHFSIGDLKALYTFAHLKYSKKQYGISYRGDAETDGTYQDIKPEAFHKLVMHFLGEENRAIIIDDMAGVQVWNKPLYRYRWVIWQDPKYDYAYLVRGYPWLVKERQQESDELTRIRDVVAPIYNYRLYVDKNYQKNGSYRVVAGQWLEESFINHPDSVTVPLKNGTIGSHNPEFNKYLDTFQKLFMSQPEPVAEDKPAHKAKHHHKKQA